MAKIVVVSTHLDDAVFSCWHVISDPEHEISVVTVFTSALSGKQGSWDACIDPQVDSDIRASERRAEDRRALQHATRVPVHLPFYDSQFGPTDPPRVAAALEPHLQYADVVYAPLAIWHSDHVLAREAVRRVRRRPRFYVDYPYALQYPIEPLQPPPGLLDAYERVDISLNAEEVGVKIRACLEYSGELDRLRRCAPFGDFVTGENLRRETVFHPQPLD